MCHSEPGGGSTFKVYLRVIIRETEMMKPEETEVSIKWDTETVLLVDNDESMRDLLK